MKLYKFIKTQLIIIFFILLSTACYSAEVKLTTPEKEFIKNHPIINVANEIDWPPFDYNEFGKPKGMSIDLIKLLAKKVGLKLNFISGYSWAELIEMFKVKKIDVMPIFYKNSAREKYTLYTKAYRKGKLGIFTHQDETDIKKPSDLIGKKVGIQAGHGSIDTIKTILPGINLHEYPETITLVQMLSQKDLDAIIDNPLLFSYIAKYNQFIDIHFALNIPIPSELKSKLYFHIGIRKDYPLLQQILNKALDQITEDEMLEIDYKWLFLNEHKPSSSPLPLTQKEILYIKNNPIIRASNEIDYMPYDFSIGGKPRGFSIDLLNLLAKQAGLNIEYINRDSWPELITMFKQGKIDLMHTLVKTDERTEFGIFSEPFCQYQTNFFIRKGTPEIYKIQDLYGKIAAVGKGWNTTKFIKKNHPQIKLIEVNNIKSMLNTLARGDADALINDNIVTKFMINKLSIQNIKESGQFKEYDKLGIQKFHFMAHKNSPELISILNKAHKNTSYKELEKLNAKWFSEKKIASPLIKLTSKEQEFINHNPVITLAGGISFAPFIYLNNNSNIEGHDVDIANIISERTGLKFDFHLFNWKQAQEKAAKREFDGLISASNTKEKALLYNSSDSYMQLIPLVIVKKDNPKNIIKLSDLSGKRGGFQRGNKLKDIFEAKCKDCEIVYFDTIDEIIKAIVSEKIDFTLLDQSAFYVAANLSLNKMIEVPFSLGEPFKLCFLLRNDMPELVSIINKGLKSISKNKLLNIKNKWFGNINIAESANDITINLTPEEQQYLNNKNEITYVIDPDSMPFESINDEGKHIGISADYFHIFEKRLKIKFTLKKTHNWKETLKSIKSHTCDLASLTKETKELKKYMDFTSPWVSFPTVIVTRNDKFLIEDISEELNKTFVTVAGYSIINKLRSKYPGIKLIEVANTEEGLIMVKNNKAFALLDSSISVQYNLIKEKIEGLKVSGTIPIIIDNTIATRRDEPLLHNIMQKALNSLSYEERHRINNKWLAVTINKVIDYTLVWQIIIIVIFILLVIGIWNRKLNIAKQQTEQALNDLQITQAQLIQTEKMAALGQLIAGIAHEINTPLGAIKSSGENIAHSLDKALHNLPLVYSIITHDEKDTFITLLENANEHKKVLSSREARALIHPLITKLDNAGITNTRYFADIILQMGVIDFVDMYLSLLLHPQAKFIFETAYSVFSITANTRNISNAVEKASKVIFALKSFSRHEQSGEKCEENIINNIETVLTLYHHLLKQGIELTRDYNDIPLLKCYPDELGQVWTNLIHNAIQAMNNTGHLKIYIGMQDENAVISISDTGCGIPLSIQDKLYNPFFTTKEPGAGTGLGLDIVKNIIKKHNGSIDFKSKVGYGTTFTVRLPYTQ